MSEMTRTTRAMQGYIEFMEVLVKASKFVAERGREKRTVEHLAWRMGELVNGQWPHELDDPEARVPVRVDGVTDILLKQFEEHVDVLGYYNELLAVTAARLRSPQEAWAIQLQSTAAMADALDAYFGGLEVADRRATNLALDSMYELAYSFDADAVEARFTVHQQDAFNATLPDLWALLPEETVGEVFETPSMALSRLAEREGTFEWFTGLPDLCDPLRRMEAAMSDDGYARTRDGRKIVSAVVRTKRPIAD